MQEVAPVALSLLVTEPAAHATQLVMDAVLYVPALHAVQVVPRGAVSVLVTLPWAQTVQPPVPGKEYSPALQAEQDVWPLRLLVPSPAGQ